MKTKRLFNVICICLLLCSAFSSGSDLMIPMGGCVVNLSRDFKFRNSDGINRYYSEKDSSGVGVIEVSSPYDSLEFQAPLFLLLDNERVAGLDFLVYEHKIDGLDPVSIHVLTDGNIGVKIYAKSKSYSISLVSECQETENN